MPLSTLAEGRLVAARTIRHVSQTIFGSGPVQLVFTRIVNGNPAVDLADPAEHDAEAALRDYLRKEMQGPTAEPPKPPQPG
jgi:hypothetical protein